jgi:hypothetical protein
MPKNTDKTLRIELGIGGKWRFFEGLERHFFAATSGAMSLLPLSQPDVTPRDRGRGAEPATRQIRGRAPFFQGSGHGFTRVIDDDRRSGRGFNHPDERTRQEPPY